MSHRAFARRCCLCHSPTLRPWIPGPSGVRTDSSGPSWRRSGARRSRSSRNSQAKAAVIATASITAPKRVRTFLSQAGPRVVLSFLQLGIILRWSRGWLGEKQQRRPSRVALASSCYPAFELAVAPPGEGSIGTGPHGKDVALPARPQGRDFGGPIRKRMDVGVVAHDQSRQVCLAGR